MNLILEVHGASAEVEVRDIFKSYFQKVQLYRDSVFWFDTQGKVSFTPCYLYKKLERHGTDEGHPGQKI